MICCLCRLGGTQWLGACRLRPNERLIDSLKQFVAHKQIQAGMITTCVGSLQEVQHAPFALRLHRFATVLLVHCRWLSALQIRR